MSDMAKLKNKVEKKQCFHSGCNVHCYIHRYALPKLENVKSIEGSTEPVNSCVLHVPISRVTQTRNNRDIETNVKWVRVD